MEAVDSHRKFSAIITPLFCSHLPKWSLHRTHKEAALNKLYQQWLDGFTDLVLALHLKKKKSESAEVKGSPGGSVVENLPANRRCRGHGFNPCVGRLPWRRKWQPAPGFLPGKAHGQRRPVVCSPGGVTKSWTRLSS